MEKRLILIFLAMIWMSPSLFAQQIVMTQPGMTPAQAVQNVLLGQGINVFNIKVNGSAAASNVYNPSIRRFNKGTSNFPIEDGVLLTTYQGQSVATDPDLNAIALGTGNPQTGVIIEFDFVPSGDTLSFNYIFASSEYTTFTCGTVSDVFGFFISGPGINGPYLNNAVNIATVPGSNNIPVSINTVNSGIPSSGNGSNCFNADPNWQNNSVFFTTNNNGAMSSIPTDVQYNGSTVILPANSSLTCTDTFHIKMAISNVGDPSYQSGVFLQANSFSSNGVDVSITPNISANLADTLVVEGCTEANVSFTRPMNQLADTLVIHFSVGGTATQGIDYPQMAPGDSIVFLPGEHTVTINIFPIDDGVFEGPESIIISVTSLTACGDTLYSEGTIWIDDEPYSTVTSSDTTMICANDSVPIWAETTFGFPPYQYSWSNGGTGANTFAEALENGTYEFVVTSTDNCGFEYTDTAFIHLNQKLKIDSLVQNPADCGVSNGSVIGYGNPVNYTGLPTFKWTGPGAGNPSQVSASAWPNKPSGWYYFTIKDNVCSVTDSILLEQNPPPKASFEADPVLGGSPLNVTFTNTSEPATTYEWDFGNGQGNIVNDLSDQFSTYIDEGSYTVTLTLTEGSCTDQATEIVTVSLPLIYDMTNVFTPNGDGDNDYFTINAGNVTAIEVVIVNRWGNVVFESTDVNFKWNGQVNNSGPECVSGVYFYKFKMEGTLGKSTEEHGFVQLFRD